MRKKTNQQQPMLFDLTYFTPTNNERSAGDYNPRDYDGYDDALAIITTIISDNAIATTPQDYMDNPYMWRISAKHHARFAEFDAIMKRMSDEYWETIPF